MRNRLLLPLSRALLSGTL